MALKMNESKNLDSCNDHKDDFIQNLKQIMDENPNLYSKLAEL